VLVLQFLYSGQASVAAPKSGPLPGCGTRGCWHTRCGAAVDLALDTLAAARSFGVEHLALLVQVGTNLFHSISRDLHAAAANGYDLDVIQKHEASCVWLWHQFNSQELDGVRDA
jgi:hypothetical protein